MIHQYQDQFDVSVMCDVLNVSRTGYYGWIDRPISIAGQRREELVDQIRQTHERSRGLYGSPRIHAELAEQKIDVCVNTVAKLMKETQNHSKIKRKLRVKTTDGNHDHPVKTNRLDRQFDAELPDRKWTSASSVEPCVDITYVPTGEGFLYLAAAPCRN